MSSLLAHMRSSWSIFSRNHWCTFTFTSKWIGFFSYSFIFNSLDSRVWLLAASFGANLEGSKVERPLIINATQMDIFYSLIVSTTCMLRLVKCAIQILFLLVSWYRPWHHSRARDQKRCNTRRKSPWRRNWYTQRCSSSFRKRTRQENNTWENHF